MNECFKKQLIKKPRDADGKRALRKGESDGKSDLDFNLEHQGRSSGKLCGDPVDRLQSGARLIRFGRFEWMDEWTSQWICRPGVWVEGGVIVMGAERTD